MIRKRAGILFFALTLSAACRVLADADALVTQGYKAYAERDMRGAEKIFLKFLKDTPEPQSPDAFRARTGLACIYIFSSDLKNAAEGRKHLEYIIDNGEKEPELRGRALFLLGRSFHLERRGDEKGRQAALEQAGTYYKQYLDLYPEGDLKSRVILSLAQVYLRSADARDTDKAVELLENFLNTGDGQNDEYCGEIAYLLGQVYHTVKNDLPASVRYLTLAVEKGLADYTILSDTLYKIAVIYDKHLNEPVKAVRYYEEILDKFPADTRVNVIRKRIEEIGEGHE